MKNVQQAVLSDHLQGFLARGNETSKIGVQMDELLALVAGAERVGRPESR